MSQTVLLHIGPPKTATTSLQISLQNVADEQFFFGGSFYPRERNAGSLCYRLFKVCCEASASSTEINSVQRQIQELIGTQKTVFLSEEMFLTEEAGASVSMKLQRLAEVMSPFECRVILTLRRARDALPSWYQETLKNPNIPKTSFSSFCKSQRAACFDYLAIFQQLKQLGFGDIRLLEFERLISPGASLGYVSGLSRWDREELNLPHANKGRVERLPTDRILPSLTLRTVVFEALGRMELVRNVNSVVKFRKWPAFQEVKSVLEGIPWRHERLEELIVPEELLRRFDDSYDRALNDFKQVELSREIDNSSQSGH